MIGIGFLKKKNVMSDSLLIPCAAEFSFSDSCLSFSL